MKDATSLDFITDLAQYDYNSRYVDLHNDYRCERLSLKNGILLVLFKSLSEGVFLRLKFTEVDITAMDFFNTTEAEYLTIDSLYRGRCELNGELIEVSEDGKGYFYLEFYEGQKLEFWARSIGVD